MKTVNWAMTCVYIAHIIAQKENKQIKRPIVQHT